ncbi:hypothetical protein PAHAL_3G251000 [Panicum hallii]|uniref:Uncharacterized protein n=1 Tax=Panicum hallii TaxID=206008 RepID=A0A2S3HBD0_9POAL|nr:hypothetical protein PAHAL_3G251000 [Panicum hallii]
MLPLGARSHPGAVVLAALGSHALRRSFVLLLRRRALRLAWQPSQQSPHVVRAMPSREGPASCHPALRAPLPLHWAATPCEQHRRLQFRLAVEPRGPRRRPPLPRLATEERGQLGRCPLGPRAELSAAVG